MSPYVNGGDVVEIGPPGSDLAVGSVILCRHGNRLLLHRVFAVHREGSNGQATAVSVAGDAEDMSRGDEVVIQARDVLGVLVRVTPGRSPVRRLASRMAAWWRTALGLSVATAALAALPARAASTFDVGSFTKSTAGAPVNQVINHTLGVAPKAILLWTAGNTNTTGFQASYELAVGVSDTVNHRTFGTASADNANTSNANRTYTTNILTIINTGGTTVAEATLQAFSTTSFTLRWTTNDANAYVIHYLVVGGTDIQADVGSFTMRTTTGTQAITGVGFRPDLYLLVHGGSGLVGAPPVNSVNSALGFGYADASGDQWAFSMLVIDNAGTSDTYRSQRFGQSLTADSSAGGGSFSKLANWVSMDVDGFTLNYNTVTNTNAGNVAYLALKGLNVHAGSINKRSGTGTQAVTGLGFEPRALFLASFQDVTTVDPIANARMGLGMGDGTSEASLAFTDADALGTTNVNSISKTDKVFMKVNNEPPTVQAEADLQSLDTGGFTLNWTTGDAAATQLLYITLGSLAPTAAVLDGVEAESGPGGVSVAWKTGYEYDLLGFRLFREERGQRTPIGPELFPGSVMRAGAGTPLTTGASYAWRDAGGRAGTTYWLEATHLDGRTDWSGPFTARAGDARLSRLAGARASATLSSATAATAEPALRTLYQPLPFTQPLVAAHQTLAGRPVLQLGVPVNGWYRVPGADVRTALGAQVSLEHLRLMRDGLPVALHVVGDAIEFFGVGLDGTHSDTRWYWLSQSPAPRPVPALGAVDAPETDALVETLEHRGHGLYFPALPALPNDAPPFFTASINATGTTRNLTLPAEALTSGTLRVELELQGVSKGDHDVQVSVDGTPVASVQFTGNVPHVATVEVPAGQWSAGALALGLRAQGPTGDISFLKVARLRYARTVSAAAAAVAGRVGGPTRLFVSGGDAATLRALDLTDPDAPALLAVQAADGGAAVHVPGSGERFLYVFHEADVLAPSALRRLERGPVVPSVAGADWIAVAPRAFLSALEPLASLRQSEGWRTALVALEEVYDAYGFGAKGPEALRRFFRATRDAAPAVKPHVLLVGDASFDPRNYLGTGKEDVLPALQFSTDYLRTAVEDTFVDFDGNGRADWPLGRLPARDLADVQAMVEKLLAPWATGAASRVEWAVGRPQDFDFEALLREQDTAGVTRQLTVWNAASAPQTPAAVFAGWSESRPKVAGYLGHGSIATWSDGLLASSSVAERAQAVQVPLLVSSSCLTGAFDDAFSDSLAETWARLPGAGAQAVVAFSGLAPPHDQITAADAILRGAIRDGKTLGEALLVAKDEVRSDDVRRTLLLLGDPAQRLVDRPTPPEDPVSDPVRGCGQAGGVGMLGLWLALGFLVLRTSRSS